MDQQESMTSGDETSEEFLALASAVRAYDRLVRQSRSAPLAVDPVDLLSGLSAVGEASRQVVENASAHHPR